MNWILPDEMGRVAPSRKADRRQSERRQASQPVAVERRSGAERRLSSDRRVDPKIILQEPPSR
jgi:hypothetical protein